ncbi:alpha/beta fold hydrolase [candidate division CSSED10-310 bacterium]|uniref:Alpha/beta fold hydrolase n=1 Tax=candidate division CSSED10-310 bacterium TaxID=2855610 RepID=A0ABV6YWG7_UNCC1
MYNKLKKSIVNMLLTGPVLLSSCFLLLRTKVPLEATYYRSSEQTRSDTLFVLLPGRKSRGADFDRHGFIDIVKKSGLAVDCVAVEAHFGYYVKRKLLPRLAADIIQPARNQGYGHIWLVGISMGGLGALLYAREHPDTISGVILLAPFLGDKEVIAEIDQAGGLSHWQPEQPLVGEADYQRAIWLWLKDNLTTSSNRVRLILGYGLQDRFARANSLLATQMSPEQVFTTMGGHDWETWRQLFTRILAGSDDWHNPP